MLGRDVEIATEEGPMPGYAALAEGATRGVVVLHEAYGRMPEIDTVVERFGDAGFAAVGPDLFHVGKLRCIRQLVAAMTRGRGPMVERIVAARTWLGEQAGVEGDRVGVIGFCLGGGLALATGPQFAAVSTNYGEIPSAEVLRGSPPVIGCYGGRDRWFGDHGDKLRRRLRVHGVEPEVHVFPSVGHSFLTRGDHPIAKVLTWPLLEISWDPEVAERGWAQIMAFFERTLPARAGDPPGQ